MVKDREIASKYHLIQTYPFSLSSDIVVSLKHQCLQFKLTSEDYQVRTNCYTFYMKDESSCMSLKGFSHGILSYFDRVQNCLLTEGNLNRAQNLQKCLVAICN